MFLGMLISNSDQESLAWPNMKSAEPNELQVRLFGPHPACLDGADDGLLTADPSQLVRPHPPRADGESDSLVIVAQ